RRHRGAAGSGDLSEQGGQVGAPHGPGRSHRARGLPTGARPHDSAGPPLKGCDSMNRELPNRPGALTPERVLRWDQDHFMHPWEGMGTEPPERMIAAEGDGIYLIDSKGRWYIDGPGGMWNV